MKTNNNNRESKNQSAYKEQQRTFGQAFDQEYYKQILEAIKGRKVFHFGIPADTVRVEVKRECEGYFRISMKRGESSDVEYFREYIDWETILSTDRAARLLADYRADHRRAHQFKLGDLVRVNDERWGQVNGHTGRIVRVVLQNRLVGSYYEVEFVGDLPKFNNGEPMKANNFEPLDIEPVEEVTDTQKAGDFVTINSDGRPAVVVRVVAASDCGPAMVYLNDWSNWPTDSEGVNVVCTPDEVTAITPDMLQPKDTDTKDDYKPGDRVRHNLTGREATVTGIRVTKDMKAYGDLRKVYRLDFGESIIGPFGVEMNGGEFVAEALTELLPEPPAEITIDTDTLQEPSEIKAEGIDPRFTLNRENISPAAEYINDLGTMYANIRPEDDPEAEGLGYCRYMTKKPGGEWTENRCMSWQSLEYALYVFNARPMTFAESVEDRDGMEKPTDMYYLAANIDRLLKRIASRGTAFAEVLSYIECYPDMGREFLDAMQCRDTVEHFRRWCAARQKHLRRKAA